VLLRQAAAETAEVDIGLGTLCQEIGRDSRDHKPAGQEARSAAQAGIELGKTQGHRDLQVSNP
jgi:hypothetical protein